MYTPGYVAMWFKNNMLGPLGSMELWFHRVENESYLVKIINLQLLCEKNAAGYRFVSGT